MTTILAFANFHHASPALAALVVCGTIILIVALGRGVSGAK